MSVNEQAQPLIVVGFDGSVPSQHGLAYAAGAARRMRGSLRVVLVTDPVSVADLAPLAGAEVGREAFEEQVNAIRELAGEVLAGMAVSWRFAARTGEAATELRRVADELGADVIVTGRSWFPGRHLLGSVPTRLIRHARCPITVVP